MSRQIMADGASVPAEVRGNIQDDRPRIFSTQFLAESTVIAGFPFRVQFIQRGRPYDLDPRHARTA